jgi:hypothetical protein
MPDIKVTNNYYPFGSLQPNRHFSDADGYRYGFNGMENDDEVHNQGGLVILLNIDNMILD